MSLKSPLLLTCAVIAITATVRSQANPSPAPAGAAPATIFDAGRPAEPRPARPSAARKAASDPGSAISPFVLSAPKPVAPAIESEEAARPDAIDLSALRYFAAQNDLGRVSSEIRLLRAKHPDWEPPQDLFSDVGSGVDEKPLWDLLSRHDFVGAQAKIDAIRRDKPEWQPTSDFTEKLALAVAHDALVQASDARRWDGVIEAASATPSLLTCGDVDALWRTAEALVRTGDEPRALAAYGYILTTCTAADVRVATVQKARLLIASPLALDGLIRMGHRSVDGRGEFDQLQLEQMRKTIGDATADTAAAQPTPDAIAAVTASAMSQTGQADAQLLGWYARSRRDYAGSERWFRAALAMGVNAKAAEGLVLALRDSGNAAEARKLAFQYAGLDPLNRKLMVEVASAALSDPKAPPLSPDETKTVMDAADTLKSSDGAQALGWHLYQQNDIAHAEGWFRKSADWQANESAAVGLVVSARRLHHDGDYSSRVAEYRAAYPRVAELETVMRSRPTARQPARLVAQAHKAHGKLVRVAKAGARPSAARGDGWDRSADDIIKVYNAGQYDTAVALLEQRRQKHAEPHGLSVVRGWALYKKGDWEGAKQVFSNLDRGDYSRERVEGLRVIQEGYTPPHMR